MARVAVIGPVSPFKGGIAAHTAVLAERLAEAGNHVTIFSWRRQYPSRLYPGQQTTRHREFPESVPIVRALCWNRPDTWLRTGYGLREFDLVVIAHATPFQAPAYLGVIKAMGRRPRVVVVCHNVLPHERHRGDERLVGALLRHADLVMVHSVEQEAVARSLTSQRVVVVGLPPHMPASFASTPRRATNRRLLFFGLIRPYKGLDVLLRALAICDDEIKLRIAGEAWGGADATLQLIEDLELSSRVELNPEYIPAPAVWRLFEDVDAVVMPYREATGSQGVAVAFEFGVPVIVTRVGNLAQQVRNGIDGLVVEPDDDGALAEAITRFYETGVAEAMRAAVRPVNGEAMWRSYLHEIVALTESQTARPE